MSEVMEVLSIVLLAMLAYVTGYWKGYVKAATGVLSIIDGELSRLRKKRPAPRATEARDE